MGLMSRAKSTFVSAAGGNFARSGSAANVDVTAAAEKKLMPSARLSRVLDLNFWRWRFMSVAQKPIDVRPVHGSVAGRSPAGTALHVQRMILVADEHASIPLHLRMASQAQVVVCLREHLFVNGTMRLMTRGAAFTQGLVLENKTPRLFAMTIRALLIEARHGEAAFGFHNVRPVRVVALHTVHLAFAHRMMLRKIELGVHIEVTSEAGLRVAARVHNKFLASAARGDVLAPGAVTRFAAVSSDCGRSGAFRRLRMGIYRQNTRNINARVRAGRKNARVVRVAIDAGIIAREGGARNVRRGDDRALQRGTGD